jgi:membrane protease subunit HflK
VPRAIGTASRLKEEADAYKSRIVAESQGDAQRFRSVLNEYSKAPQVTRDRLYLETMQEIYGRVTKVMVDSRQGSNLMYLPLDKLMQLSGGADAAGAAMPAAPQSPAPTADLDARSRLGARSRERETR